MVDESGQGKQKCILQIQNVLHSSLFSVLISITYLFSISWINNVNNAFWLYYQKFSLYSFWLTDFPKCHYLVIIAVFPGSSADKESACNAGHHGLIPESGRSPGEGIGLPTPVLC